MKFVFVTCLAIIAQLSSDSAFKINNFEYLQSNHLSFSTNAKFPGRYYHPGEFHRKTDSGRRAPEDNDVKECPIEECPEGDQVLVGPEQKKESKTELCIKFPFLKICASLLLGASATDSPGQMPQQTIPNLGNPSQYPGLPAPQGYPPMPAPQGYKPMPAPQGYKPMPSPQGYKPMPAPQGYHPMPAPQGYQAMPASPQTPVLPPVPKPQPKQTPGTKPCLAEGAKSCRQQKTKPGDKESDKELNKIIFSEGKPKTSRIRSSSF